LIPSLREAVRALDPEVAPKFTTLEQSFTATTAARRFNLTLIAVFAGVALGLASLGIYGVLAYAVERRTREIGIRMAVGAQRSEVLWLVVGQGLRLVMAGVALGVLLALALTRYLGALLYGVTPADPLTYVCMVVFVIVVALAACWVPARRAARVDPHGGAAV